MYRSLAIGKRYGYGLDSDQCGALVQRISRCTYRYFINDQSSVRYTGLHVGPFEKPFADTTIRLTHDNTVNIRHCIKLSLD